MQRAVSFWQGLVLFLVLSMTLGIYACLGVLLQRLRAGAAAPELPAAVIQVVAPSPGAIVQRGTAPVVQAAILEPDWVQAELLVDGQPAERQVNDRPSIVPWLVDWSWPAGELGVHALMVQAWGAAGQAVASVPVTVTVVPAGRLLFASNREGNYAVYAMGTDGQAVGRLTAGPGDARRPALRADGQLVYVAESETGRPVIRFPDRYLVAGLDPAWSPLLPGSGTTETYLAYAASVEGVSQVWVLLPAGGVPRPLTAEPTYAGQPAWSPAPPGGGLGGAQVAYVAEREGNWDIWLVALEGTGPEPDPRRLTDHSAMDWAPAWSPDGSHLAFVSERSGSQQIYVMRADGSDVQRLTSLPGGAESPAWSPDGAWLAFVSYSGEGAGVLAREIYVGSVDGDCLVRLTHNRHDDAEVVWAPQP